MTIRELFEAMRLETDWDKEVVVMDDNGVTFDVSGVMPNIILDDKLILSVDGEV
jgi:hypothetical protein